MESSPPPSPMSVEQNALDERDNGNTLTPPTSFESKFQWTDDGYLVPFGEASAARESLLLEPVSVFLKTLHPLESGIERHSDTDEKDDPMDIEESNDENKEESDEPTTPPEYTNHVRVVNLIDSMRKAISCIDKLMQVKAEKLDKKIPRHMRHQHNKIQALEKQQQARLLQRSQSNNVTNDRSDEADLSSSSSHTSPSHTDNVTDEVLRLVRATNSIRALVPVVVPILHHKQSHDRELVIHGVSLRMSSTENNRNKKLKRKCFLIGEYVFDVASSGACEEVKKQLNFLLQHAVCRNLQDPQQALDEILQGATDWNTLLPSCFSDRPDDSTTVFLVDKGKTLCAPVASWCDDTYVRSLVRDGSLYDRAVHALRHRLDSIICRRFKGARLKVYGSCLSDLYLGESSDVDLSLHLAEAHLAKREFVTGRTTAQAFERTMKRLVYQVSDLIRHYDMGPADKRRYQNIQPVARARVPVIKGKDSLALNPYTPDGALNFDICFLNEIAVANSSLLREYSLVDLRAKQLMLSVKKWTQHHKINSAADNFLSSYAWMNLVVFYLQCLGLVPNLQCPSLMSQHGLVYNPEQHPSHRVNDLNTVYLPWARVQEGKHWSQPQALQNLSVTVLLYGFFAFYDSIFPDTFYAVSIKSGRMHGVLKSSYSKAKLSVFSIEDPFETFDSHTPHDLAMPCNEKGQTRIRALWKQSRRQLERVLFSGSDEHPEWKQNIQWIWSDDSESNVKEKNEETKKKRKKKKPKEAVAKGELKTKSSHHSRKKKMSSGCSEKPLVVGPDEPLTTKSSLHSRKKKTTSRGIEKPLTVAPDGMPNETNTESLVESKRRHKQDPSRPAKTGGGEEQKKKKKNRRAPRRHRKIQKAAGKDYSETDAGGVVAPTSA